MTEKTRNMGLVTGAQDTPFDFDLLVNNNWRALDKELADRSHNITWYTNGETTGTIDNALTLALYRGGMVYIPYGCDFKVTADYDWSRIWGFGRIKKFNDVVHISNPARIGEILEKTTALLTQFRRLKGRVKKATTHYDELQHAGFRIELQHTDGVPFGDTVFLRRDASGWCIYASDGGSPLTEPILLIPGEQDVKKHPDRTDINFIGKVNIRNVSPLSMFTNTSAYIPLENVFVKSITPELDAIEHIQYLYDKVE